MKKIILFLFLLISIGGYAQQEFVNLTAVRTGKCYMDKGTNMIRSLGVYDSNGSLVLDYRPSKHGRITVNSSEYYDLVSLRRMKEISVFLRLKTMRETKRE